MLIIPAIHIQNGLGRHRPDAADDHADRYSFDPVRLTNLLRGENAKTIHVVDLDGAFEGLRRSADAIREMCSCVEIALQVAGGFRTYESVEEIITLLGVYRVVVGTMAVEDPDLVGRLVRDFSARKIVVGIDASGGIVRTRGRVQGSALSPVGLALRMRDLGVERIIYAAVGNTAGSQGPPIEDLMRLSDATGLRITLNGSVRNRSDLALLESALVPKLDSVILHEPLYRNVFPCQAIWRMNERMMEAAGLDDGFPRMQQRRPPGL